MFALDNLLEFFIIYYFNGSLMETSYKLTPS